MNLAGSFPWSAQRPENSNRWSREKEVMQREIWSLKAQLEKHSAETGDVSSSLKTAMDQLETERLRLKQDNKA